MILSVPLLILALATTGAGAGQSTAAHPHVTFETTMGKVVLELYPDKAPKTVANFLAYVKAHHYDGTIFHRVIPGFVVQGGGFTADMTEKPTKAPVKNESNNGLSNERGTISMARTSDPDSATAQFFISVNDNKRSLDYKGPGTGYAVFGKVIEGMDVVDKIVAVPTTTKGPYENVPVTPIKIVKATASKGK
ncbi:MAG: peptidyl-prolyl cis-trans isomerase [Acidobacteriota bacterium]|jgi:peptidyl-prolyl cis-trans isomerase A (cyclophilin A)|nr:peptidyl-prolyl cis-trans isomerase [Acidobacteriota bacterium]